MALTAGQIIGRNIVCTNAGATTFRFPPISQWTAMANSFGDSTTRAGRGAKVWVTNLTGNALTIDITTNAGYTLWDDNTNSGWTVNKQLGAGSSTALFYFMFAGASTMNVVYAQNTNIPQFV